MSEEKQNPEEAKASAKAERKAARAAAAVAEAAKPEPPHKGLVKDLAALIGKVGNLAKSNESETALRKLQAAHAALQRDAKAAE